VLKDIKRFVDKKFLYTVDLQLLRRLLEPYQGQMPLDLDALAANAEEARSRLFEWLTAADESYPSQMLEDLHRISELSTELGMGILRARAEALGIKLIPAEEMDEGEGMHLNPRYVALRAFLDHRKVFDSAVDILTFFDNRSPGEFVGEEEGVPPRMTDAAQLAFEQQAAEFFNSRYQGHYCRTRWYPDEDGVNLLVIHGNIPVSTVTIEEDEERPRTFREVRQDTITYDQHTGRVKVTASGDEEKQHLCDIFAETILGRPSFFQQQGSRNLYTLARIVQEGPMFQLDGEWDPELVDARLTEIQVDSGERGGWMMRVRDPQDALLHLLDKCPELDLSKAHINYVKLRFVFSSGTRKRKKTVKIKPPSVASFNRSSLEAKVLEHLRRNGFCIAR
jgi:hypothetical protein